MLTGLLLLGGCEDRGSERPLLVPVDAAADAALDASAGPDARATGSIRVATFNVHRFFDAVCDSDACAPGSFEEIPTEAEVDAKAARIASAIVRLDADVIALQEIENEAVMTRLGDRLAAEGFPVRAAVLGETGAPASMDVAVVARADADVVRRHRDVPLTRPDGSATRFSRELLEVHLGFGGRAVIVFAAHFRSKVDDDPGRRFAEAAATREIVIAAARESPGALVVLGGDLNDEPGSAAIDALEKDGALVRVARDRPLAEQTTATFAGRAIAIDHLYVPAADLGAYVPGSARVVGDPGGGLAGSDHAALYADFVRSAAP